MEGSNKYVQIQLIEAIKKDDIKLFLELNAFKEDFNLNFTVSPDCASPLFLATQYGK